MSSERPAVYLIEHTPTWRVYVGSAANLSKRWSRHRSDLAAGTHKNTHLQAAWKRYGAAAFRWRVLAFAEVGELLHIEQAAIDHYRATDPACGFNKAPVAGRSPGSPQRTEEWRATMREVMAGRGSRKAGDLCGAGHVIDGSQVKKRKRPDGTIRIGLRCQECTRLDSLTRARAKLGIPDGWPTGKHFNRRRSQ